MKHLLWVFIVSAMPIICVSQTETLKADTTISKKSRTPKTNGLQKANPNNSNTGIQNNRDSQSSGITLPDPVIIFQDEEKVKVQ